MHAIEPIKEEPHHKQHTLCETRPPYRQGRRLTAVKVYTIASESQHLCIYGVPKINLRSELKTLCSKYGEVKNIHVTNYPSEIYNECFHVQFKRIQSARIAKRFIDDKSFYGSVLHVCYAPEFESIAESREKMNQRRKDVMRRLSFYEKDDSWNRSDVDEISVDENKRKKIKLDN